MEGGRAGGDIDGGKRGRTKDKDKVGGKIVFDKDWLCSCPKELFEDAKKKLIHSDFFQFPLVVMVQK